MKRVLLQLLFVFLFAGMLWGQKTPPNFIIFIADDVSWDDLGCYGNKDVKTPTINKLAGEGIVFTNTYLTASSCSPSRNSIMTGRYPHNTGAAELHTQPSVNMLSVAEVLKKSGYYTVSSGKFHMGDYARRGFDLVHEDIKQITNSGSAMWMDALKKRPKNKPFFMWFASLDAHRDWGPNKFSGTHHPDSITAPFYLSNAINTRKDLAAYYDEIKRFDSEIGLIIRELEVQNALKNTFIIIMADNGRPFPHSKTRVNDRGMKTPFIIYWPQKVKKKGAKSSSLISSIDIAPTLLKLAGLEIPEQFQGISFDALIDNPEKEHRSYVFAEHNWHDYEAHERMLRTKEYLYILNSRPNFPAMGPADAVSSPSFTDLDDLRKKGQLSDIQSDIFKIPRANEELYNCKKDSLQLLNIASVPENKAILEKHRQILNQWMAETGDDIPENLTKSWYKLLPGYHKTNNYEIRGSMPGSKSNAVNNNNKGLNK